MEPWIRPSLGARMAVPTPLPAPQRSMSDPPARSSRPASARAEGRTSVLRKAERQHGVITRRNLLAAGYSPSTVTRLVRRGILQRMHRGVYHAGLQPTWKSRFMAAVLAAGPGAALSHTSAAMAWDLLPQRTGRRVHVTIPPERAAARPGLRIHRTRLDPVDRTTRDRIPITTPARTLADLSSLLPAAQLERVLARAARAGLARGPAVQASALRRTDPAGRARLRRLLEQEAEPAFTRSKAESLLLDHVRRAELPAPSTNAHMEHWELDFLWREARLVVEVDGFRWHASRDAFEQDRLKDQWLESRGYRVLRFTWRQVQDHPLRTVATIARMLAGGE
jgi:very-short-patch-repair endonuclease